MNTAQDLLQQPSILVVLAGLFILTAIIIFVVPTFSWLVDKLKSSSQAAVKSEKKHSKKKKKSEDKDFSIPSIPLNTKQIAYASVAVIAVVIVGVLGWYVYTVYFAEQEATPDLVATPKYDLEYTLTGTIKDVNHDTMDLVVLDQFTGQEHKLKLNSLVKAFIGSEEVAVSSLEKDQNVLVRSNADFASEQVNIFEVSIIRPIGLPEGNQGEGLNEGDLP